MKNRAQRAALNYGSRWPDKPSIFETDGWLVGTWMVGNNYRATNPLYGAYPPSYLARVHSLFPEAKNVLHLFSGGLTYDAALAAYLDGMGDRKCPLEEMHLVDSKGPDEGRYPTHQAEVTELREDWADRFDLIIADPPYSKQDAVKYGVKMVPAAKVFREARRVAKKGANIVWLDLRFPMHRKVDWKIWGTLLLLRSTNNLGRSVTIFEAV